MNLFGLAEILHLFPKGTNISSAIPSIKLVNNGNFDLTYIAIDTSGAGTTNDTFK